MKRSNTLLIFGWLICMALSPVNADTASTDHRFEDSLSGVVKGRKITPIAIEEADIRALERHSNSCLTRCWAQWRPRFHTAQDRAKAFLVKADAWMEVALEKAGDALDWAHENQDAFWGVSKFVLQLIGDDKLRAEIEKLEKKSRHYGSKAKKILGMVDAAQDVLRTHAVSLDGIDHSDLKRRVQSLFMDLVVAAADGKSNSRIYTGKGAEIHFGYQEEDGETINLITFGAHLNQKDVTDAEPIDGYTVDEKLKVSTMLDQLDGKVPGMSSVDKALLRRAINSLSAYGGEVVVNDTNHAKNNVAARSVHVWAVGDTERTLPPIFKFHVPQPTDIRRIV